MKYDQKGSNATAHLEHLSLSRVICVNGNGRVSIAFLLQVRMTQSDNPTMTVVTDSFINVSRRSLAKWICLGAGD